MQLPSIDQSRDSMSEIAKWVGGGGRRLDLVTKLVELRWRRVSNGGWSD
uniref:Uncharacterized protein n=1 Tax=Arundo donax TaxID=35708 RepID=A0A0A9B386_ARUDO